MLLDKEGASSINEARIFDTIGKMGLSKLFEHKTSLMVDVTYGSIDVIKLILLCPEANVNFAFPMNKSTALNCVVYGGFVGL